MVHERPWPPFYLHVDSPAWWLARPEAGLPEHELATDARLGLPGQPLTSGRALERHRVVFCRIFTGEGGNRSGGSVSERVPGRRSYDRRGECVCLHELTPSSG